MGISLIEILGIHEDSIEHAWEICEEKLAQFRIDRSRMDEVQEYIEDNKSEWNLDDITNSIISQILDETQKILEEEYIKIEVSVYVNGWDSHIHTAWDDLADILQNKENGAVINFFKSADSWGGLGVEKIGEISDNGCFEDFCRIFENGNDLTFYDSVAELGEDNADNGCREKDDTDESFGQFLIKSYFDGSSGNTFYFEFKDGTVVTGVME